MTDFKPIETQEEFDNMIKERLNRAEKQFQEKYADYDELKSKNTELETKVSDLTKQNSELMAASETTAKTIEDYKVKIHNYETNSVKMRVANELGIGSLVDRIRGETEDEIKKDAQALKDLVWTKKTPEPQSHEKDDVETDPKKAALKKTLEKMRGDN